MLNGPACRVWKGQQSVQSSAAAAVVFSRLHRVTDRCGAPCCIDNAAEFADAASPNSINRCSSDSSFPQK